MPGELSLSRPHRSVERTVVLVLFLASSVSAAVTDGSGGYGYFEAQALVRGGKWAEAAIALRAVLKERPSLDPALFQLSQALLRLDRRSEATSLLVSKALRETGSRQEFWVRRLKIISSAFLSQDSQQSYLEAVHLLDGSRPGDARSKLLQVVEKEKDNFEVLLRLGQSSVLEGDYDTGVERLRAAIQVNPFESEARLWLGRALMKRGEGSQATQELSSARQGLPDSVIAPVWLAEALTLSGQRNQAVELLIQEVRIHPDRVLTRLTLARLRYEAFPSDADQLAKALEDLSKASTLASEGPIDQKSSKGELGLNPYSEDQIKAELKDLKQTIEIRLERIRSERPFSFGS